MTLLLSDTALEARRRAALGPLAPLARSLRADLEPLVARGFEIPRAKALLSREGGRCARDGTLLAFDPYAPHEHRCPLCGARYEGERHDRWRVMWYQLWLAERAVHAALLYALTGEPAMLRLATDILAGYGDRYLAYPNRDNVLGPSRPFFSTYLESIWMLQVCVALDLLESMGRGAGISGSVRDRLIAPSSALVASYDEGMSNRQVWNNAAIIASALMLGAAERAEQAIYGPSGLLAHITRALLTDGSWYEGENYHFFAHRGLWYGVVLAETAGFALPPDLVARFDEGFAAPLATVLPDYTFPSRRDSQYAISLRQWRFAESFELGLVRGDDPRLLGALWELYERRVPRGDTGRWRSTAESERNEPASSLTRADLNWRSLLLARPDLPPLGPMPARSALLPGQGIGVLRRDGGRVYVALDYGESGGGHGHPDRLNMLLVHAEGRWLDDMGTGSYVDPSLYWYRSTLAHNAPLVDGRSQSMANGVLRAWDERGGAGWIDAEVPMHGIAPAVRVRRSVVVMPDYVIDRLTWSGGPGSGLELPLHAPARVAGEPAWHDAAVAPNTLPEDGYAWARDVSAMTLRASVPVRLDVLGPPPGIAWIVVGHDAELARMKAPAAPSHGDHEFHVVRMRGASGTVTTCWSWAGSVADVGVRGDEILVYRSDGTRHEHSPGEREWHVDLHAGAAHSSIDLAGTLDVDAAEPARASVSAGAPAPFVIHIAERALATLGELTFELGRESYRRSELSWEEAGSPGAWVSIGADDTALHVRVAVEKADVVFRPADAPDPALDNEHPDIHSDGVQLHVMAPGWTSAASWLAVPDERTGGVRVREVPGSPTGVPLDARWSRTASGYEMMLSLPLPALAGNAFAMDVIVNDMGPGRERRRGQLVLSGGAGDYIYLKGDRHDPSRFWAFVTRHG